MIFIDTSSKFKFEHERNRKKKGCAQETARIQVLSIEQCYR